jgi:hypothetical protein
LREVIEEAEEKGEPDIAELLRLCALRCQLTDVGGPRLPGVATKKVIRFREAVCDLNYKFPKVDTEFSRVVAMEY